MTSSRLFVARIFCLIAVLGLGAGCGPAVSDGDPGLFARGKASAPAGLPREAADTLALIQRGGPFPYRKDGIVFQNRERRLPAMPRGYYREYTVPTPGSRDRGARRIVTGGNPPDVYYYTADHYRSFRRIEPRP
jgi:guanyl-specific ribonuclease Sa